MRTNFEMPDVFLLAWEIRALGMTGTITMVTSHPWPRLYRHCHAHHQHQNDSRRSHRGNNTIRKDTEEPLNTVRC